MKAGHTVLDRYQLLKPLPAARGQLRWAALDTATQAKVDVVSVTRQLALRPGASDAFDRAQQRSNEGSKEGSPEDFQDAWQPVLAAGSADGRSVAARPTGTPLDPDLRISSEDALGWASWLAPAILRSPTPLQAQLTIDDLVIDTTGCLRIAPTGLAVGPRPLKPQFFRPPDLDPGQDAGSQSHEDSASAALYGLGVILFHATTGAWPLPASTEAERRRGGSPRRASQIRPDLAPQLDALIAQLLSGDPAHRLLAAAALPRGGPVMLGPRAALQPATLANPQSGNGSVALTTHSSSSAIRTTRDSVTVSAAQRSRPRPAWAVTVGGPGPGGDLSQAALHRLSAILDLPDDATKALIGQGLALPVRGAHTQAEADEIAAGLSAQGLPATSKADGALGAPALTATLMGLMSGLILLGAAALPALSLVSGPLVLALLFALITTAAIGGVATTRQAQRARDRGALTRARRLLAQPLPQLNSRLSPARASLRAARRAILGAQLAPPVRVDLEGLADQLQTRLDAVEQQAASQPATTAAGASELADLLSLIAELQEAAQASSTPDRSHEAASTAELHTRLHQRVEAARAAAQELGPRG